MAINLLGWLLVKLRHASLTATWEVYRLNTGIEWHTPILLAFHRRGHSAEEAAKETDAEQAVSKVEAAMTAAEKAAKETDAAEAARAYAEEASKTLKGKRTSAKW